MIGRVNAGGGGSLQATDAILRVIAPAGSTVTISKGGVTKSDLGHENAADTSLYDYYFIVHQSQFDSVNPWTVTATLGTDTASDTIIINSADEYDVELSFRYWFVRNGDLIKEFTTVGMKPSSSSGYAAGAPTVTDDGSYISMGFPTQSGSNRSGIAYANVAVDLSRYSTLRVVGTARNGYSQAINLAIDAWTAIGSYQDDNRLFQETAFSAAATSYTDIDKSIDVSALTVSAYIGINATNGSNYSCFRITDMWLE